MGSFVMVADRDPRVARHVPSGFVLDDEVLYRPMVRTFLVGEFGAPDALLIVGHCWFRWRSLNESGLRRLFRFRRDFERAFDGVEYSRSGWSAWWDPRLSRMHQVGRKVACAWLFSKFAYRVLGGDWADYCVPSGKASRS